MVSFKISSKVNSPLSSRMERYLPILTDLILSFNMSVFEFAEKEKKPRTWSVNFFYQLTFSYLPFGVSQQIKQKIGR